MGIVTIGRFLIGQRQAILDIAASRHAIWLGLLFVFSAGFAREYDGEDLLHELWHLLIPLIASLATSTLLYCLLWIVVRGWVTIPNEWRTFGAFVTLYWMTAPLAWLYAIPVERFLTAADSVTANYWLLGIVATWRVLLIIRVASVLFQAPAAQLVLPVLLFSHTVLVALTIIIPAPILAIMGGVRLSEADKIIAGVNFLILMTSQLVWPVLAIGTIISVFAVQRQTRAPSLATVPALKVQRTAWLPAAASLAIWFLILPLTQPQQQRRWQAEQLMKSGEVAAAVKFMSQYQQQDFPPHWDPPPLVGVRFDLLSLTKPGRPVPLIDVVEAIDRLPNVAPWIRETYRRKFEDHFEAEFMAVFFWDRLSDNDFDRYLNWIERHPLPDEVRASQRYVAAEGNTKRSREQIERWCQLLQIEPQQPVETTPPTTPMPNDSPETPPPAASADEGTAADKRADTEADR
jgi:hypothetical protein